MLMEISRTKSSLSNVTKRCNSGLAGKASFVRRATKVLQAFTTEQDSVITQVMSGIMEKLPPLNSRVVRIFLSSTFSDMASERNILMEEVYPRLKDYCREKHGIEFQVIDMRWGVRGDSQLDHQGPRLCYQEVANCQSISMGPSFIVLLGQRYGGHPPPCFILDEEFEHIIQALKDSGESTDLLSDWYKLDENNIPPVYTLRAMVEDFSSATMEEVQAAKSHWRKSEIPLLSQLRKGIRICSDKGLVKGECVKKFHSSVTENEIRLGLLESSSDIRKYCSSYMRHISNVDGSFSHPKIGKFLDINEVNRKGKMVNEVDTALRDMMDKLHEQVTENINFDHIHCYDVPWKNGITPTTHREYLEQFADDFYTSTKNLIDKGVSDRSKYSSDPCYVEVLQHLIACVNHVRHFQGRQNIIQTIADYICGDSDKPFVVYGASGSGKTSVLAKAASSARDWIPEDHRKSSIIIIRFLGTSPATSSILQTIKYLCQQLATFGNENDRDMCRSVEDFRSLVDLFYRLLERFGAFRRIVIFLDSLDQLDSSSGAYHLTWLRTTLPHNVKIIVSTLPEMFNLLSTLREKLPCESCFVEVRPLEQSLCHSILKSLLNERNRDLSAEQWKLVCSAFEECSLPIFVLLIFHQVLSWKSYQSYHMPIAITVRGAIKQLFENIERKHGKVFTHHALAYITASRNGLSEVELEDLLSLDDEVLRDVFEFHLPPLIRIPPLCWTRLRQDIGSYLVEREADNTRVIYWYHRQFIEVAREYFLGDENFKKKIHSNLADYFLGVWGGGREKPFRYPKYLVQKLKLPETTNADRMAPSQPYIFEEENNNSEDLRFNLRKLNELPLHLICSGRIEEFYDYVALDFEFLFNKLRGTSRYLLLRDLSLPHELDVKTIPDVKLAYNAIRLAAQSLLFDPTNIVVDLIGRLKDYEDEYYRIHLLLNQCRTLGSEYCSLIPLSQCFESGSGLISTSFDVGISFGVVTKSGMMLFFSMISNDLTWYDFEGNFVKTVESDYNLFMVIKYLFRILPLEKNEYVLCVHAPKMQTKAERYKELERMEKEYEKKHEEQLKKVNEENSEEEDDNESEAEDSSGKDDDDDEEEEGVRDIDVVKFNLETGMTEKLWSFSPEIRELIPYDNIEFVTNKFIISVNAVRDDAAEVRLLSIEKKEIVETVKSINKHLFEVTRDGRMLCSATYDNNTCKFNFKNLDTGYTRTWSCSEFAPLIMMDMGKELCVVGMTGKPTSFDFVQLRVFEVEALLNEETTGEVEAVIMHNVDVEGDTTWPSLNLCRRKPRQKFVSEDQSTAMFHISNGKLGLPGIVWHAHSRSHTMLNHKNIDSAAIKKIYDNWGSSTLAMITPDNKFAFTTASKTLFLTWSLETGTLIRIVTFGEAESMICGMANDKLVIAHFPDESATDDTDERMFIMCKLYNIREVVKPDDEDKKENEKRLPICNQKGDECMPLINHNNIVVHKTKDDLCYVYDTSEEKFIQKSNADDLPAQFSLSQLKTIYRNDKNGISLKQNSEGVMTVFQHSPDGEEDEAEEDELMSFSPYDTSRSTQEVDELGIFDSKRNIIVLFGRDRKDFQLINFDAAEPQRQLLAPERQKIICDEDCSLEEKFENVYDDKRTLETIGCQQIVQRPNHAEHFVAIFSEESEHHKIARNDNVTFWGGFTVICDFSQVKLIDSESDQSSIRESNTQSLKFVQSNPFDIGPRLILLDDGIHAINYRLHIYNIETGERVREIQSDFSGTFMEILITSDYQYVIGQYLEEASKIEFAIFDEDSSLDSEEMYMRIPPRTIQIYRISDGKRMSNYCFEMDPYGMFLSNDNKALVMMFHNEPLRIFKLATAFKRPRTSKSRGGKRREIKTTQKAQSSREKHNGPKNSYLVDLDLNSILIEAFKVLVDQRPRDPIAVLSQLIREKANNSVNGIESNSLTINGE